MLPRRVIPGTTYLLTRRTIERRFLLRPGALTNQIVAYCLAVAAERTGVEVHAFCAMSNHVHSVVTDAEGRLPEFLQFFHRHVAVAMNASLGRTENFWSSAHASAVELGDAEDILEKMVYVIANPTAAGLVKSPQKWPGVITTRLGTSQRVARPQGYFSTSGRMPEFAFLNFSLPKQLEYRGLNKTNELLFLRLSDKVRAARNIAKEKKLPFLGAKKVMKMPFNAAAVRPERLKAMNPRFAIGDKRLRRLAKNRWRAFILAYKDALHRWGKGEREARFPEGTWLMRRVHAATCGPPMPCAA